MANETAITPTRDQDYPEWYQQVIKAADLAENSAVRGCMVIKPWGYGIWERIQAELDQRFKATGHENAYFPLLIPLSFLEKEAAHVSGFAKECAVVTHHRLVERDGKLVPEGELEEPLIIRPTSETIIGDSFSRWVQSYRDLPVLINQWCNVMRWEMRTRMFLRTAEFLWQEGHTCHATAQEAMDETKTMLEVYREFCENILAVPVITGEKPHHERFPGAVTTYCVEAMMQDKKALQAGTSHYLGQNFANASNIKFLNEKGEIEFAHTTSWGVSTRLIGGLIMTHSDDDGLRLPPKVAPKHVVILPVVPKPETQSEVFAYCEKIAKELRSLSFDGIPVQVTIDKRDIRGGDKSWSWIKKGIPVRIEIGPRDIAQDSCMLYRRDRGPREKQPTSIADLKASLPETLLAIQRSLYAQALAYRDQSITTSVKTLEEFKQFFANPQAGFVKAHWCEEVESLIALDEFKVTVRCAPLNENETQGTCVLTGKPATKQYYFGRSY